MQLNTPLLNRLGALALAMAMVSSACSSDDGGGGGGSSGSGVQPAGEPTFAAIYTDIITKGAVGNCTFGACHGQPPNANSGMLELFSNDKDMTYARLVGPTSTSAACGGMPMVTPGNPQASLLYLKLLAAPPCGVRMPFGGMLTDGQIEQIRLWIANGAQNNGMVTAGTGGVAGMMTGGVGGMTGGAGGMTGGAGGMGGMTGGAGGMTGGMGGMTGGMGGMTGGMGGMTGGMGGGGGMMAGGTFTLTSTAFMDGGMIPNAHRCLDENPLGGMPGPSPALAWTNPPEGTMSFAITLTDNSNDFAHWTVFDIPAATTMLPMGVAPGDTTMPAGSKQSANSFPLAGPGYFGPCGTTNNPYEFTIYALDVATLPGVTSASARSAVQSAIDAAKLGEASITGMSGPP